MAPPLVDKVYLPDIEPCLRGETVVLSWTLLASALADTTGHRQSSQAIIDFLTNPHVQTFFTKPATTFEPDNAAYKQSFETRTSAVQVTPTPNDKYDVKTIKEDSVWLSETAHINLVAALRVVIIEFQSQPRSQLTGPISNQDVISLQEAAGATNAQTTNIFPGLNLSGMRDATDLQEEFKQEVERRRRIFQTYLAERRYFAMALDYIFTLMLHERLPTSPATDATTAIRNSFLNSYGLTSKNSQSDIPNKTFHALVSQFFALANESAQSSDALMQDAAKYEKMKDEDLRLEWVRTFLIEDVHFLTVAFQLLDVSDQVLPPAELVLQWFGFVGDTSFVDAIGTYQNLADLVSPIQCLMCVISLAIFNLPRVLQYFGGEGEVEIDGSAEYIGSPDALQLIHDVVCNAADRSIGAAMPVAFAWVPILHGMYSSYQDRLQFRDQLQNQKSVEKYDSGTQMIPGAGRRNSAGSIATIDKTTFDDFLKHNAMDQNTAPVSHLAAMVTNEGMVYNVISVMAGDLGTTENAIFAASVGSRMRLIFSDLLKETYPYVGYKSESVGALLSVLSAGHNYWNLSKYSDMLAEQDIVALTLGDEALLDIYLFQAVQRFPYEFAPFANLCRILSAPSSNLDDEQSEIIMSLLQKTPCITFELPGDFDKYNLAFEEDNANAITLYEDLPLFEVISNRKRLTMTTLDEEAFIIPAGTVGRFVVDSGRIVQMKYNHSALALLGKRLEVNLSPTIYQQELGILGPDEVAEAISLLATLVRSEWLKASRKSGNAGAFEAGVAILAEASRALPRTKDIISVVCETLDVFIESDLDGSVFTVLTACLQFFDAILRLSPGRLWSYMARCTLLGNDSRAGRLSKLIGTLELSNEQFEFLTTSIRFFSDLIDSAMSSSVQRKAVVKSASRQQPQQNIWLGISDKIVTQITVSISQSAIDILESSSTWRFPFELQRSIVIRDLLPIMNNLILYTFSMDDILSKKALTTPLESASKYVIDSFLSPSAGSLRIQPLLVTLVLAVAPSRTNIRANALKAMYDRTNAVLDLATTLVRVANYFDESSTTIERQLFKATPFVARVCAVGDQYRKASISLLEALVVSAGKATGEPPSLLGYLGPQTSLAFLQLLSRLDKPFNQAQEVHIIWRFLSTIIRNRQQWMSNCILTGKTPRDARKGHDETPTTPSSSVLSSALTRLASISTIPTSETLSILDFVTSAQNYWPWTIFTLQKHEGFLAGLRAYVRELKSSAVTAKSDILQACNEARIAAYIAETFAMQLFHLRQLGQAETLAKDLSQDLDYFLRDGVEVSGFNNSLHTNFAKNFSTQYPGCTLGNFKRTLLEPRSLGVEYYYALNFADKMLSFDSGWVGPRNNGYKSEMEKANANLSLVDAQIALFHAWEFLLLELSNCLPHSDTLKKQSLQVAQKCLEANQATQGHEQIFERLTESRVDLALMLVQRVVDNTPSAGDVAQLLNALWATASTVEEPYSNDNVSLYRTLLKLLYVTLRAQGKASSHASSVNQHMMDNSTTSVSQTILGILDRTVAKGFRSLVSMIHDSDSTVFPEDIAILTAIMQACLCVPGINQSQTQIVNIMAAHDAVHVAVSLYSWSDKLADKGDPVYGELSLLFLLELSALPQVAEQLACDGLLNHLTSANLAKYLNRPNVSPFADSVGPQRCYSIWAKAIVPLLLNILMAMGQTIAPEVAYVLNQFPNLMTSCIDRFDVPGASRTQNRSRGAYVTLLCVSEIHSLALMTRVLAGFRVNNVRDIPEVEWDSARMLENAEFWLDTRRMLRERLFPLGQREAEWKAMPPSDAGRARGCDSLLEERVVEQLEVVRVLLSEPFE